MSQCLPMDRVCDNIQDCEDGADEDDCVLLAPRHHDVEPTVAESMHIKGLLYWKVNWKCIPDLSRLKTNCTDACTSIMF